MMSHTNVKKCCVGKGKGKVETNKLPHRKEGGTGKKISPILGVTLGVDSKLF